MKRREPLIVEVPTVLTRIVTQLRMDAVFPWSFYVRWLNARYPRRMFMRRGWLDSYSPGRDLLPPENMGPRRT